MQWNFNTETSNVGKMVIRKIENDEKRAFISLITTTVYTLKNQ